MTSVSDWVLSLRSPRNCRKMKRRDGDDDHQEDRAGRLVGRSVAVDEHFEKLRYGRPP